MTSPAKGGMESFGLSDPLLRDHELANNPSWITKCLISSNLTPFCLAGMFIVYILYSQKLDRFYVGYTNQLERRISEHNRKKRKYTDIGIPWAVVYTTYS